MEKEYKAIKRFESYYYDNVDDLKYHMLYMKRLGYSVWRFSLTDLYAEYEMYEEVNGTISLDDIDDADFV